MTPADLAAEREAWKRRQLATAPPLTQEQIRNLRRLLAADRHVMRGGRTA